MATPIPVTVKVGPYPTLPVTALSLDIDWTVGDTAGNTIAVSGSTSYLLLMYNSDAGASHTVTIASVADSPFNRTGNITAYVVAESGFSQFYFQSTSGWVNTGTGLITVTPSTTDISFLLYAI